jgi:hypothetical protein
VKGWSHVHLGVAVDVAAVEDPAPFFPPFCFPMVRDWMGWDCDDVCYLFSCRNENCGGN